MDASQRAREEGSEQGRRPTHLAAARADPQHHRKLCEVAGREPAGDLGKEKEWGDPFFFLRGEGIRGEGSARGGVCREDTRESATFHSAAAVSSLTRMMEAEAAASRCCVVTPSRVRCSIASSQTSRPEYSVTVSVLERAHAKMADIAIERAAQTESSASAQKRRTSTMVTMARRVRMQAGRLHRVEAASSALPTHLRRCISSSAA